MKRNFVTLGLISLALAACSGGENGLDGKEGKDGASCTITNNEDGTATISCPDGSSFTVKNGEDGKKGDAGSDGENGTSCTANVNADGEFDLICGGQKIGTIKNGEDGDAGSDGQNGTSCTANVNADGDFDLICGGQKVGIIKNGENGKDGAGCSVTDGGDGTVTVTCGDDEPVTLYKAMCGSESYDPAKSFCLEGELFSCDGKPYDPKKQFCKLGSTVEDYGWLTDTRDKQVYKTVKIADQVWMAENLNYDPGDVSGMSEFAWSGCYRNESANCSKFGRLYTWEVAMDNANCPYSKKCNASLNPETPVRGVCPEGWHLPSHREFEELLNYIDPNFGLGHTDNAVSPTAGKYLKSQSGWYYSWDYNGNGDDSYGFSALPGSYRLNNGQFGDEGFLADFWSSSEYNSYSAFHFDLYYGAKFAELFHDLKNQARSVRCLENSN